MINPLFVSAVWKPALEKTFQHHPNKTNLINAMIRQQLTTQEIDQAFNEAEVYTWSWWTQLHNKNKATGGTVTYKIRSRSA